MTFSFHIDNMGIKTDIGTVSDRKNKLYPAVETTWLFSMWSYSSEREA